MGRGLLSGAAGTVSEFPCACALAAGGAAAAHPGHLAHLTTLHPAQATRVVEALVLLLDHSNAEVLYR